MRWSGCRQPNKGSREIGPACSPSRGEAEVWGRNAHAAPHHRFRRAPLQETREWHTCSGVQSGVATGDTWPVPHCFEDRTTGRGEPERVTCGLSAGATAAVVLVSLAVAMAVVTALLVLRRQRRARLPDAAGLVNLLPPKQPQSGLRACKEEGEADRPLRRRPFSLRNRAIRASLTPGPVIQVCLCAVVLLQAVARPGRSGLAERGAARREARYSPAAIGSSYAGAAGRGGGDAHTVTEGSIEPRSQTAEEEPQLVRTEC